eukprot:12094958-Ditylum_brightwellii.AAC.1
MLVGTHKLIATWSNKSTILCNRSNDGVAFTTDGIEGEDNDEEYYEEIPEEEEDVALTTKGEEVLQSKKGEKIICYTCGGNQYAKKYPDSKKNVKASTNVTVGDDGVLIETRDWGSDEGLTGIVFCTNGSIKIYKHVLLSPCSKSTHKINTDHILQQAG